MSEPADATNQERRQGPETWHGGIRASRTTGHGREITELFAPVPAGVLIDATLGGGGHARALLDAHPHLDCSGSTRTTTRWRRARRSLPSVHGFGSASALRPPRRGHARRGDRRRRAACSSTSGSARPSSTGPTGASATATTGPLDMRMDRSPAARPPPTWSTPTTRGELAAVLRTSATSASPPHRAAIVAARRCAPPPSWPRSCATPSPRRPAAAAATRPSARSRRSASRSTTSSTSSPAPSTQAIDVLGPGAASPCSRTTRARTASSSAVPRRPRPAAAPARPACPACAAPTPGPPAQAGRVDAVGRRDRREPARRERPAAGRREAGRGMTRQARARPARHGAAVAAPAEGEAGGPARRRAPARPVASLASARSPGRCCSSPCSPGRVPDRADPSPGPAGRAEPRRHDADRARRAAAAPARRAAIARTHRPGRARSARHDRAAHGDLPRADTTGRRRRDLRRAADDDAEGPRPPRLRHATTAPSHDGAQHEPRRRRRRAPTRDHDRHAPLAHRPAPTSRRLVTPPVARTRPSTALAAPSAGPPCGRTTRGGCCGCSPWCSSASRCWPRSSPTCRCSTPAGTARSASRNARSRSRSRPTAAPSTTATASSWRCRSPQSVFVDPSMIDDAYVAAAAVAPILGLDEHDVEQKMRGDGRFAYLARKVTDEQADKVAALGIKGVALGRGAGALSPLGRHGSIAPRRRRRRQRRVCRGSRPRTAISSPASRARSCSSATPRAAPSRWVTTRWCRP